jgi:hypothetical protein
MNIVGSLPIRTSAFLGLKAIATDFLLSAGLSNGRGKEREKVSIAARAACYDRDCVD